MANIVISKAPGAPPVDPEEMTYHCVCGESLEIDPIAGSLCHQCGRKYCPSILNVSLGDETILVSECEQKKRKLAESDAQTDPLIGTEWGHYKIVERLGRGGMGAVYRALDESLQRYVALKVLREGTLSDKDSPQVQQLFQEARAQARVNHPNVVHIYYVGKREDSPFFAMELIGGPTLEQRLERGPLEFREVIRIAQQVTQALKQAARYDIVHGDIKPSNILQVDKETVKLSDFGLARKLSELHKASDQAVGTPNYLSPEAAAGKSTDFRSDMYCLGVTLFELTFGRLPYSFTSTSVRERLEAHLNAIAEYPEPWPQSVPEVWREVLDKLLAKNPEDRYANYDELLADLKRVQPLCLPAAGRLQRGLAWLIDLSLSIGAQAILYAPFMLVTQVHEFLEAKPLLRVLAAGTTFLIPLMLLGWQCRVGQTIGKKLFQIRVVDRHGLPPAHTMMVPRSVFQFLFVWSVAVMHLLAAMRLHPLLPLIELVVFSVFLVEIGFTFFTKKRRSLHDVLFRTQVVLDAGETNPARV